MQTTKLFREMTAEEQLQWATGFGEFLKSDWPLLEPVASGNAQLTLPLQKTMASLLTMLMAWPFSRDFAGDGLRYNDFANRAYRLPLYIKMVRDALQRVMMKRYAPLSLSLRSGSLGVRRVLPLLPAAKQRRKPLNNKHNYSIIPPLQRAP